MAERPISYRGRGFSLKGEKGRFVLPPIFRKEVRESSFGQRILCLDKHPRWDCLVGFGQSRADALEAQIAREEENAIRRGLEFDRDLRAAQLFGYDEVPFDESGRFAIPEELAVLAGVEDALYFNGGGEMFTIWNPAELYKMGPELAAAQARCRALADDPAGRRGRK